ncbi:juvenile hormone esterase-like [Colletes gigas]|uniref:juvenile hormone esterase-like n=1 Tax=Colletes gigas TaxID=935657 RepID=UPI001C9B462B|nr:juvenile hormone esterase-like [Colletes gigas]XP_043248313.1 juvenile hormone esterase-like [Colletes gigas]XP_043248314.1 juvenile hormone esterase-like [Colletes gigas]
MKCTFVFAISLLATAVQCHTYTSVVQTDKGPVRGRQMRTVLNEHDYSAFLGIPYAKPPLGDLRFRDPVEAEPWKHVINATVEAPLCMQKFLIGPIGKEDCLYLNVYTPLTKFTGKTKLKPVMVWIYGGGYISGGNRQTMYGPDWFIEDDIVMVAMNYRLGPMGFLALGLPDASGNQGLKDQNLALKWVQKNIAKFGGDPNKVTIMGESAGASSVIFHMLSPMSAGLFHQGVTQSGSALCAWAYKTPKESLMIAYELGAAMGFPPTSPETLLERLKKARAYDITQASDKVQLINEVTPMLVPFVVTTEPKSDNAFLPNCPISTLESGKFNKVPMLMGYNAQEAILFSILIEELRQELYMHMRAVNNAIDPTGSSRQYVDILDAINNGTEQEVIKMATSFLYIAPIDLTQKLLTKHSGDRPIYYYRLSFNTDKNFHRYIEPQLEGTSHEDDLPLLFYIPLINPTDPDIEYNVYSKRVVSMWTNFIKYTDPTPSNNTVSNANWLPSGKKGMQLDIGNEDFVMYDRLTNKMDEDFEDIISKKLKYDSGCEGDNAKKMISP